MKKKSDKHLRIKPSGRDRLIYIGIGVLFLIIIYMWPAPDSGQGDGSTSPATGTGDRQTGAYHAPARNIRISSIASRPEMGAVLLNGRSDARLRDARAAPYWKAHAVDVDLKPGYTYIAVIIDDMGINRTRSRMAARLPGPLTLSYLPYARQLQHQTSQASANGHELMLHIPMEPLSADIDPGPGFLKVGMSAPDIQSRLDKALAAFEGYAGVNNHMGSRFTQNDAGMNALMNALRQRGLFFIDSLTISSSAGHRAALRHNVPYLQRQVFLDHRAGRDYVRRSLANLETIAQREGFAVAIGHPKDDTIHVLRDWIKTLESKKIQLVPVSALIRDRAQRIALIRSEAEGGIPAPSQKPH